MTKYNVYYNGELFGEKVEGMFVETKVINSWDALVKEWETNREKFNGQSVINKNYGNHKYDKWFSYKGQIISKKETPELSVVLVAVERDWKDKIVIMMN